MRPTAEQIAERATSIWIGEHDGNVVYLERQGMPPGDVWTVWKPAIVGVLWPGRGFVCDRREWTWGSQEAEEHIAATRMPLEGAWALAMGLMEEP